MLIKAITVGAAGDQQAGILPTSFTIKANEPDGYLIDTECYAEEDIPDFLRVVRNAAADLGEEIYGEPCGAVFDFEQEAAARAAEAAESQG